MALGAAGASFSYISQDVADVLSPSLTVGVVMAVVGAWVKVGSVFAARLLALAQGMVWFFLLIHGGLGLAFGPAGWAASALGKRAPMLAVVLLAGPATVLLVSWLPILFSPAGLGFHDGLAVVVLIAPALVAAGTLLKGLHLHGGEPV